MLFVKSWIKFPLKIFANLEFRIRGKILRIKLKFFELVNKKYVKSTYGVFLKANYEDVTFRLCILGCYGNFYCDRLKNIDEEFIFLDIGANQGIYSLIASQNSKNYKTYAFEPVPQTFNFLKENINYNNLKLKCFPIPKAISNKLGTSKIAISPNHSGSATLASRNNLYHNSNFTFKIDLIDSGEVSKIVKEKNYPIYIKIDVEGHEKVVINELIKSNFFENVKEIFFEVDLKWVNLEHIKQKLLNKGFKSFQMIGSGQHFDILATKD